MVQEQISIEQIFHWLAEIPDPEIPVLSVLDLGIVRNVAYFPGDEVHKSSATITITPTYSGCPAMDVIGMNIRMALMGRGINRVNIEQQLSPAWTTDWITEDGKRKMSEFGIAPPQRKSKDIQGLFEEDVVPCPRCHSVHTEMISRFGATSCKSMYRCMDCKEPFEHFKCH